MEAPQASRITPAPQARPVHETGFLTGSLLDVKKAYSLLRQSIILSGLCLYAWS
jgi:hypothetical protein